MNKIILFIVLSFFLFSPSLNFASQNHSIYINRSTKKLHVLDGNGTIISTFDCGIGRGRLQEKKSMGDYVTPTGDFIVDLIIFENGEFNQISQSNKEKFESEKEYKKYLKDKVGLSKLFKNMNNIDFDNNQRPDQAYGTAYIGLDSKDSITGPKLNKYRNVVRWYSIGIHGTPNETNNISASNSGGCIHLKATDLKSIIEKGILNIGTKVKIGDEPLK